MMIMMQRFLLHSSKTSVTSSGIRCLSTISFRSSTVGLARSSFHAQLRVNQPSVRLASSTPPSDQAKEASSSNTKSDKTSNPESGDQSQKDQKKDSEPETGGTAAKAIRYFIAFAVLGYVVNLDLLSKDNNNNNNNNDKTSDKGEGEKEVREDLADLQAKVTNRVFLDIKLPNKELPERIVIGLYGDVAPKTVLNFKSICEGFKASDGKVLSFKGCNVHRVIPAFMMQSGDFTNGDGTGGRSIFTTNAFPDESFQLKHRGLGILSMANSGPDTNRSQFFICFEPTPWLDGRHVVFGQVLHGASTLRAVEKLGSRSGRVQEEIRIVDCGVLPDLQDTLVMNNEKEELDEMGHNVKRIMK